MTISVGELFESCGLQTGGLVKWGQRIRLDVPGVYAVSSTRDIDDSAGSLPGYAHDSRAFTQLRSVCPAVTIDGRPATDVDLAARIGSFWIPNSAILYVGLAGTSLQKRVTQYYRTGIGQRSPHAGGWWLKTLAGLDELYVHYAPAPDPKSMEAAMLATYAASVPGAVRRALHDTERVGPFANVDVRPGGRKRHGMANYKRG